MLDRSKFITTYQAKARANLAEATACLRSQLPRAAINRSYYALYQAANAWLVFSGSGPPFDPDHPNLSHEEVDGQWREILDAIHERFGVEADFDGDRIYGRLKNLRVWVDYKPRLDPTMKDAESAVSASIRAVSWLAAALEKGGR